MFWFVNKVYLLFKDFIAIQSLEKEEKYSDQVNTST